MLLTVFCLRYPIVVLTMRTVCFQEKQIGRMRAGGKYEKNPHHYMHLYAGCGRLRKNAQSRWQQP